MPHPSIRTLPLATALALLASPMMDASAIAADDPEGAVAALFEVVSARQLDELDGRVCVEQQEVVREAFGDAALGIDLLAQSFGSLSVSVEEPLVEIAQADEASASARIRATLSIEIEEAELREFVRRLMETSGGPDDPPVSDAEIDEMLPFVAEELALDQPLDSQVSLVVEDGTWVVCDGFGASDADAEDRFLADPVVSTDGLCALATPAELSDLGALEYDASTSLETFCTYSQADWDAYHDATVSVIVDSTLQDWRTLFPPDAELEVAGAPAFASGGTVFSEAGDDVLQVSVTLPREAAPGGVDAVTQAERISALFLPRLTALDIIGPEPRPEPGGSLCDGVSLVDLNGASGRDFDSSEGDRWICTWSASDADAGLDTIVAAVTDLTLEEFRAFLGDATQAEVDGMAVLSTPTQAVVELPDGRTLDVSVYYDVSVEPTVPASELALTLAERLAPAVPAEPGAGSADADAGLLAGRAWVDDVCRIVPYEDLSSISGIAFDDPGFDAELCDYQGGDERSGWHLAITSLESRPLSAWIEDYPEATLVELNGVPAMVAEDVIPERGASALFVTEVPGNDELTLGVFLGIDTSTGTEVDAVVVVEAMAELGLARLLGNAD